jgi:hypothetical protein
MQIIAVIACVVAAVLGAASLTAHSSTLQSVVGYVTDVWVLAWVIVIKAYTREYWTYINRPIRESEYPPARTGLARAMTFGMIALVAFDTVLWFA